jgi:hypothetical protein
MKSGEENKKIGAYFKVDPFIIKTFRDKCLELGLIQSMIIEECMKNWIYMKNRRK